MIFWGEIMSKTNKKYLITGHPRCGTGYMAKLMQKYGFDIKHEEMGKDGISSWIFTVKENQIWVDKTLNKKDYNFENLVMVVRNPFKAIPSIVYTETLDPRSIQLRAKYIKENGKMNAIEFAINSYIKWNNLILDQSPDYIVKLEQANQQLSIFLDKTPLPEQELPDKNTNTRKHPDITIKQIENLAGKELTNKLINMGYQYDYTDKEMGLG